MAHQEICSLVRELESEYVNGTTQKSKYVDFSMPEVIETIYAYLSSKHISGSHDSMGREKPFFNICTAVANIWYRATDIDRKNIRIKPTKREDVLKAFIASVHLQEYMRKDAFGKFLNTWGLTLARFGSAVLKFVEKDGELHSEVVPWQRLIVDAIDFKNNPVIEVLELTPAQLRNNSSYDQEVVEALIKTTDAVRKTRDGKDKDDKDGYIKLYEIHGELPLSYLTYEEEDETQYVQQMHVVAFVKKQKGDDYEDFTLVSGKEDNPYMITHLIEEEGQTLGIGAVQHLFEAQWMVNHSQKAIKDQLDLVSKVFFQTPDRNYAGRNALTNIEVGDILYHEPNQPLTQVNNGSHDIGSLQSFMGQWQVLAKELTSTPDAIAGNTFPSGTAYRQVVALQQEAHSLFEIMTENKGLAIEDMMRTRIIPFIIKKMDSTKEIVATLDEQQIQRIDSVYIPNEAVRRANQKIIEEALRGVPTTLEEGEELVSEETEAITSALAGDGNQRFLVPSEIAEKTWKDSLGTFAWDVEVEVTNETTDKEAVMTTLTTVMQTIATNPEVLQDPNMKALFNKILVTTGEFSPLQLATQQPQPTQQLSSEVSPEVVEAGA